MPNKNSNNGIKFIVEVREASVAVIAEVESEEASSARQYPTSHEDPNPKPYNLEPFDHSTMT